MKAKEQPLSEYLEEIYGEIITGFIIELNKQNVEGRDIGKRLAKITEIMEAYNA